MELTTAIQEALLSILCYDGTPGGAQTVAALIPAELYDPYYRDIAQAAIEYLRKYEKPPGEHTLDVIDTLKARKPDSAQIFEDLFRSLESTHKGVNRQYVIAQASAFSRYQRMKAGVAQVIDKLNLGTEEALNEAEALTHKYLEHSDMLFDAGTLFTDTERSLRFFDKEEHPFLTGIKEIDELGLGPARKRLHLFTALPGRGKSHWLVNLGKWGLISRARVLYVTLELSEEEVSQRFYQSFFSVTKRKEPAAFQQFETDELGRFVSLDETVLRHRPSLEDQDARKVATKKVHKLKRRPPLIIKEFPTGSLDVSGLNGYLDALEGARGFIPDLLLVDYGDLMKLDSRFQIDELDKLYKDLRGIGVKRNIAVATASQVHRAAETKKVITGGNTAGAFAKTFTADYVLTYNQTPAEHGLGLARLYQDKGRTDKDKFTVLIAQAYALGQFCMDSARMVDAYWKALPHDDQDEDGDDDE